MPLDYGLPLMNVQSVLLPCVQKLWHLFQHYLLEPVRHRCRNSPEAVANGKRAVANWTTTLFPAPEPAQILRAPVPSFTGWNADASPAGRAIITNVAEL